MSYLPENRVTLLFSGHHAQSGGTTGPAISAGEPLRITIAGEPISSRRISHSWYCCDDTDRIDLLLDLLKVHNPDSCIIFANMRAEVEDIYDALWDDGFSCARLHGGMEQWERTEVMRDFKRVVPLSSGYRCGCPRY